MNPHDDFWRLAMRHAYEDSAGAMLTASEQVALLPLRAAYRAEEPITLNEGTPYEEPFGPTLAIQVYERMAREVLA